MLNECNGLEHIPKPCILSRKTHGGSDQYSYTGFRCEIHRLLTVSPVPLSLLPLKKKS